jgi:hypothetical protein
VGSVLPSLFLAPTTIRRRKQSTPRRRKQSNPKPSFNTKREVRKETLKPREEAFVCMFSGRAGHLDGFCFYRKRIQKRHFDYARNSYRNGFTDFLPCPYSHAAPSIPSCAVSHFFHGPNHRSCG